MFIEYIVPALMEMMYTRDIKIPQKLKADGSESTPAPSAADAMLNTHERVPPWGTVRFSIFFID